MLSNLLIMALKTQKIAISVAALELVVGVFAPHVLLVHVLFLILVQEHIRLRLKVLYAKVGSQDIFSKLLLQFLFDFLTKSLVHLVVVGVKLSQNHYLKASDNSLLGQFQRFLNLHYLFVFEVDLIEVVDIYELMSGLLAL